jgi:hypothetical protein
MTTDTSSFSDTSTTGSDSSKAEQAKQAASTAADETKHVAGVAASEAQSVAAEAKEQVRSVVGDAVGQARGQLDDQSRQQKDKLAGTLSTFGDDLSRMSEQGSGLAAQVADEVAERARSLSRHLDGREPSELLDDVRRFARQRPGTFLLGALAAGVVAGRLLRGTKDAVEAAEAAGPTTTSGTTGTGVLDDPPYVTPGAPVTTSVHATHGQPTQPPTTDPSYGTGIGTGTTPPSATGYSSPPAGTGLPASPSGPQGGSL